MSTKDNYNLIYMDKKGDLVETDLLAVVRNGNEFILFDEFIPLPEGSDLLYLPDRLPLAYLDNEVLTVEGEKEEIYPLCAILPAGYTRLALPAYENTSNASILPLFGYSAVVGKGGELFVAARQTDDPHKGNPLNYPQDRLPEAIEELKKSLPKNRLVEHLAYCALEYHCLPAMNIFLNRWEGGIPSSTRCNANCLGCISLQESECCPSPQARIDFSPSAEEIAELALYHLSSSDEPTISFGQGCEGEPLLAFSQIKRALKIIRNTTDKGIINMNTNAYSPERLLELREVGLDSIRITMISNIEKTYQIYHKPQGFNITDIRHSIKSLSKEGVFISLNLLTIPGLNDMPEEISAWESLLQEGFIDLIQIRNLNIDPDYLFAQIPLKQQGIGISKFLTVLSQYAPIGNFSLYDI